MANNDETRMPFDPSPDRAREIDEIVSRYPLKQPACIPVLHVCQEQEGYCSDEVVAWVARRLDLPTSHVLGVVTFYTLFRQAPGGRHRVWVCRTLPCALRGSEEILRHCEKRLGIHAGETTPDGAVTLNTAECLASCGTAPMMQVDKTYHENLTPERVDVVLETLGAKLRGVPAGARASQAPRSQAPRSKE
ncbi:MAG: NADH-quinone oxidoreductase subunit NuoE [Polyangiales bacterium]